MYLVMEKALMRLKAFEKNCNLEGLQKARLQNIITEMERDLFLITDDCK